MHLHLALPVVNSFSGLETEGSRGIAPQLARRPSFKEARPARTVKTLKPPCTVTYRLLINFNGMLNLPLHISKRIYCVYQREAGLIVLEAHSNANYYRTGINETGVVFPVRTSRKQYPFYVSIHAPA